MSIEIDYIVAQIAGFQKGMMNKMAEQRAVIEKKAAMPSPENIGYGLGGVALGYAAPKLYNAAKNALGYGEAPQQASSQEQLSDKGKAQQADNTPYLEDQNRINESINPNTQYQQQLSPQDYYSLLAYSGQSPYAGYYYQ